jgi:anti-sigma regulatory factor (Ser/Thr protein kinase)
MARAGLHGRDRAASVFAELAGNAAEHSRSQRGAFVAAQAYAQLGTIEIAVADVGIGIRASLNDPTIEDDAHAIQAALQEGVTGRRDAAGNLTDGGFGLPTAAAESATLLVRSGSALITLRTTPETAATQVIPNDVAPLRGTLVIADVSS